MSANYNKFKSTTVYGNFQNSDLDANNTSNAIFDRNVSVKGTLESNDASFNTIKLNGNITSNSLTITPTQIGYLKDTTSNIQSQINYVNSLLTGASYSSLYGGYLNFGNNIHIYGALYLGADNNLINVNNILSNLPSTYCTINALNNSILNNAIDLSNNYVKYTSLSNYVTNSSLTSQLSNYVTNTSLTSQLSNYVTNTSLTSQLSNYTTTAVLNNTFASLSVVDALSLTLFNTYTNTPDLYANFPTKTFLTANYTTTTDLSNNYLKITSLASQLSNYVQSTYLTSNYTTTTDLSNNYLKITSLANYVQSSYLTSNYTTTTDLSNNYLKITSLANYVLSSYLTSNYTNNIDLSNQLSNYVQFNYLTSNFVSTNALNTVIYNNAVDLSNNYVKNTSLASQLSNYVQSNYLTSNYTTTSNLNANFVSQNKINTTPTFINYNQINSTVVYGVFKNMDLDVNNPASAYFQKNVIVDGILNCNNGVFTNINITQSLNTGFETISSTELSHLKNVSSNIQSQLNSITTNYVTNSSLTTSLSNYIPSSVLSTILTNYVQTSYLTGNYTTTVDLSNNYVKIPVLATQLLSYAPISSLSSYATVSSLSSYAPISSLSSYATVSSLSSYATVSSLSSYATVSSLSSYDTISQVDLKITILHDTIIGYGYVTMDYISPTNGLLGLYSTLSYVNTQFIGIANNFLYKTDASNNYLKITDASNNYVKNTTLTSTLGSYVTSTSLTSTLGSYVTSTSLTSTLGSYVTSTSLPTTDLQVASLNVRSANSNINIYTNTGVLNGTISSTGGFFNLTASGNSTSGFKLTGGYVILGTGYRSRQGTSGTTNGHTLNQWWTGTALQAWVDTSNVGNFTICDYRIKENIQPPSSVLERLCNVNMFNYEFKDISIFKKNGSHIGFYAHELKDAFPELNNIVDGQKDALTEDGDIQPQTVNAELTHLLMKSIQELNAKVIELSNKIIELENKLS